MTKAGREVLVPESYQLIGKVNYPIWRWLTAPIEVLWGPDAATVIVIIVFILLIGGSVAVLDKSGILRYSMQRLVNRFGQRKYVLIGVLVFFFMALGALIGTFEEIVVLVPLTIGLAISLGWDSLTGLGMSLLAAGFGFAAAISNPFTVGVAQRLAGLPAFSGIAYRVLIFLIVYVLLLWFLVSYAKKVEKSPEDSLVYKEDQTLRVKYATEQVVSDKDEPHLRSAIRIFSLFLLLILAVIVAGFFVEAISAISLPLVAIVFTVGAICAGVLSKYASAKGVVLDLLKGMTGILPAILLILMAMSVKHIMVAGKTMDTVLQWAADRVGGMSQYMAGLSIYILILFLELFSPVSKGVFGHPNCRATGRYHRADQAVCCAGFYLRRWLFECIFSNQRGINDRAWADHGQFCEMVKVDSQNTIDNICNHHLNAFWRNRVWLWALLMTKAPAFRGSGSVVAERN